MTSKSKFFAAAALLASVVAVAQTGGAPASATTTTTAATPDAGTMAPGQATADGGMAAMPASNVNAPSPEAVKQVWDYYYYGKGGGPILADVKLCLEIGKAGATKSDCVREMTQTDNFRKSQRLLLWQAYLMPQDEETEVEVQAKLGDTVRSTTPVKVKGSAARQRTWTTVNMDKPGKWTITFLHKGQALKTMEFEVK